MTSEDTHLGHRLLVRWVELAHRWAIPIIVLALLVTIGSAYVTAARIGISTSTSDMLSEDLPFQRNKRAMREAFPQFRNTLSVVVEAAMPDEAEDAAARLAAKLRERPDLFGEVFYPGGEPFFRRNGLLYMDLEKLEDLSDRLANAQPLLSALNEDLSLRGLSNVLRQAVGAAVQGGAAEGADLATKEVQAALEPAFDDMAQAVLSVAAAQAGEGRAQPLSWITLMSGEDPTPEDKRRFIAAQTVFDYGSLRPAARSIDYVRQSAADLGLSEATGVRVRMTGRPIMFQEELDSLTGNMGLVGLLSSGLMILILAAGMRSARLVATTLLTLFMGLTWTAGFATLAVGELNLISVAFAVLFIGLSVDFGIHFALRYKEAVDARGADAARSAGALVEAARGVGGPLTLCAVAAAIGFFSFMPTAYRGLSELGLISGGGMFIALFANLTVLPALLSVLPLRPGGPALTEPAGARLQRVVTRQPRRVLGGAALLGLAACAVVPFAWFDDDPLNLRDPNSESVATLLDLLEDPRVRPYTANVLTEDLSAADDLAARLERLAPVDSAVTLSDYVPSGQDEKLAIVEDMSFFLAPLVQPVALGAPPSTHEQRRAVVALRDALQAVEGALAPAAHRFAGALARVDLTDRALDELERVLLSGLPARLEALGEALEAEPVTIDTLPAALRARAVAPDGRARVEVNPRENLYDGEARRRFVDAVRSVAPTASGSAVTITEGGRAVVRAFAEAAVYAVVLITALLLALLRSVRDSVIVLAPLVLAALLTVAATVAFRTPFNFANVIVLPLLFGLGVASGIHIVTRAGEAGAATLMATSTPRAVLLSALTTIGSFGALAVSSHRGMSSMGVVLTVAISLTLLCTLVVLPALLSVAGAGKGSGGAVARREEE